LRNPDSRYLSTSSSLWLLAGHRDHPGPDLRLSSGASVGLAAVSEAGRFGGAFTARPIWSASPLAAAMAAGRHHAGALKVHLADDTYEKAQIPDICR
jgi:hypothetical protein